MHDFQLIDTNVHQKRDSSFLKFKEFIYLSKVRILLNYPTSKN